MFNEHGQTSPLIVSWLLAERDTEHFMGAFTGAVANSATSREETLAEVRQLIEDLRDAAQDGRDLARRYADVLTKVVEEYCVEFEKRAELALARLEADQ
jgi:hypothetical protein